MYYFPKRSFSVRRWSLCGLIGLIGCHPVCKVQTASQDQTDSIATRQQLQQTEQLLAQQEALEEDYLIVEFFPPNADTATYSAKYDTLTPLPERISPGAIRRITSIQKRGRSQTALHACTHQTNRDSAVVHRSLQQTALQQPATNRFRWRHLFSLVVLLALAAGLFVLKKRGWLRF